MTYTFNEALYPPAPRFASAYRQRVEVGRARLPGSKVFLCGLARDLGYFTERTMAAVDAICGLFLDHRVFIYENDSVDDTKARLDRWAMQDAARRTIYSEQRLRPKWASIRSGLRGDQMAEYRNVYHNGVRDRIEEFEPDYVLVLDTDLGDWSLEGIISTIGSDHWDAMGANGRAVTSKGLTVQHDAWAWRDVDHPHPHAAVEVNHRLFDRGHPPVPVDSCFGGMAVYRTEAFLASAYSGGDCEHVPFHLGMAAAGYPRVFCNPGMVTVYR